MSAGICSIVGCGRQRQARGWCIVHYARWRRSGDVQADVPIVENPRNPWGDGCIIDGCERRHYGHGYCQMHLVRIKRSGSPDRVRGFAKGCVCKAPDCERPVKAQGYCKMHYQRLKNGVDMHQPAQVRDGTAKTYYASHQRTTQARGAAKSHQCLDCGSRADHWAYSGADPNELYNEAGNTYFSADPSFYDPLCGKCHMSRDARLRAAELREYRAWKYRTGLTLEDVTAQHMLEAVS